MAFLFNFKPVRLRVEFLEHPVVNGQPAPAASSCMGINRTVSAHYSLDVGLTSTNARAA